jgi:hypothetical protein
MFPDVDPFDMYHVIECLTQYCEHIGLNSIPETAIYKSLSNNKSFSFYTRKIGYCVDKLISHSWVAHFKNHQSGQVWISRIHDNIC